MLKCDVMNPISAQPREEAVPSLMKTTFRRSSVDLRESTWRISMRSSWWWVGSIRSAICLSWTTSKSIYAEKRAFTRLSCSRQPRWTHLWSCPSRLALSGADKDLEILIRKSINQLSQLWYFFHVHTQWAQQTQWNMMIAFMRRVNRLRLGEKNEALWGCAWKQTDWTVFSLKD